MRTRLLIAVLAFWPMASSAQVVPPDATPEIVLKTLGTPRSRSATKGREIWLYPGYQVVFENGRVISLLALPSEGGANITWQKRPATAAPENSATKVAASPASPTPAPRLNSPASSASTGAAMPGPAAKKVVAPSVANVESGKIVLRSPERRPPPTPPPSFGEALWRAVWPPLLMIAFGVGLGAGAVVWLRRRLRRKPAGLKNGVETAPSAASETQSREDSKLQGATNIVSTKPPTLADWELTPELLREMEWKRFELLVERFYGASGFRTRRTGVGADDGVDVFLYRPNSQRPLRCVQCKAWGKRRVDVARVRELFGVMSAQRVPEGALVTTGSFTPDALLFGRQNRLMLIGGDEFLAQFNRLPHIARERILREVTEGDYTTPSCPRCGVKLSLRLNREDQTSFWGCQRYPRCHYTMQVKATVAAGE
jgi:restriction system protein